MVTTHTSRLGRRTTLLLLAGAVVTLVSCGSDSPVRDAINNRTSTTAGAVTTQPEPATTLAPDLSAPATDAPPTAPPATTAPATTAPPTTAAATPTTAEAPTTEALTTETVAEPTEDTDLTNGKGTLWWPWVAGAVVVLAAALVALRRRTRRTDPAADGSPFAAWRAEAVRSTADVEAAAALLYAAPTTGIAPDRWSMLLQRSFEQRTELVRLQQTAPTPVFAGLVASLGSALGTLESTAESAVNASRPAPGVPLAPSPALLDAHQRVTFAIAALNAQLSPPSTGPRTY